MKFNEFYMDKVIRYVVAARNRDYQYLFMLNTKQPNYTHYTSKLYALHASTYYNTTILV